MKPIDWLEAFGAGIVVMIADLAIATIAVFIYVLAIDPGHPKAYYTPMAAHIATPCTAFVGPMLLYLVNFRLGRGKPARNAYAFAGLVYLFYFLGDWSVVAFQDVFTPLALIITALKLTGALLGAWASRHWPDRSGSATA